MRRWREPERTKGCLMVEAGWAKRELEDQCRQLTRSYVTLFISGVKYIISADEDSMPMGRPRQYKQTARLSVSFEKADYDRVTALAEAHDVSTAWIIRKAVRNYLDDNGHSDGPFRLRHRTEGIGPDRVEEDQTR